MIKIHSKLPEKRLSIFSKMSKMATDYSAINLSQGFPNFETDQVLKEYVSEAMRDGYNQYPPAMGTVGLRQKISEKISSLHQYNYNPETEILITAGATQAIYSAVTALIQPGDEVIVLKPAYDSYEPTIKINSGIPVLVQLEEDYSINWEKLELAITPKTRMIIINSPHNPSGSILNKSQMERLQQVLQDTSILLLSDEVYEHLIFDGNEHQSASRFPGLAERAIVCASFGKTFHNTGWKTGYCVAPEFLMKEILKIHEQVIFSANHPMQRAYEKYLQNPENYLHLPEFYQKKRDFFLNLIKDSNFNFTPSKGTYFQLLGFQKITDERDTVFAERLVKEYNIASIPVSVFNIDEKDQKVLRFCFAKTDETLEKAAEILCKL